MEETLNDDVMFIIFRHFNANERAKLKVICKRWCLLLGQMSTGKLVLFEFIAPFTGKLKLKDEHWSYGDTMETSSLERLFRNHDFLGQFKGIQTLVIYGNYFLEKSKRCSLNIAFENLTYLELHHCNYENLDHFQSHRITHLFLNRPCALPRLFTNFRSLLHVELTHLNCISDFFGQMFATNLLTLKTENYLDAKDVKKLIRYCPKLERLHCKLTHLALLPTVIGRLRNLKLINFYTSDCSELSDEAKNECRDFVANKRPGLVVVFCGLRVDAGSISFLFDFIEVKKYHNWSIIETNRILEIIGNYSELLDSGHLDEYFAMTKMLRLFGSVQLNEKLYFKLSGLKKLLVSSCKPDNFLLLINRLTELRHLSLNSCYFEKAIYDQIPVCCRQLTELVINSCKLPGFAFIYNLKSLQQVVLLLDRCIQLDSYTQLIENCYYLVALRANVAQSVTMSEDELICAVSSNAAVQMKVRRFPTVNFKFSILQPDFLNSTVINSEIVRRNFRF